MNIVFLTSGHIPFDDRIFHHFGQSLTENNNKVEIISSKQKLSGTIGGIIMNCFEGDRMPKAEKIEVFREMLEAAEPEIIICSEPLPVLAARRYKRKQKRKVRIIYDITEWYPSRKNLTEYKIPFKIFFFAKLFLFNIWCAGKADSFIFGEYYKSRPYRYLFPFKPFVFIPYYPDLKYISSTVPDLQKGKLRLSYSGKISLEKGFGNFISVLGTLIEKDASLKLEVIVIGWYETPADKSECEHLFIQLNDNIKIKMYERQSFNDYIELIKDCDIFIDLRSCNFENKHCLPIKLFYYAALGRPVIYSDLKAIRKEVEIDKFGFLVNPANKTEIARILFDYINDEELYYKHCRNARNLSIDRYNWKRIECRFLKFFL
jgi:glycosyltransferase involved in cell wall biosynthesis